MLYSLDRLLIGIILSICTLYVKGIKPYYCLLGYIPETRNIYVDINQHRYAIEIPQTKIFRYTGSLNFATANSFRKALRSTLNTSEVLLVNGLTDSPNENQSSKSTKSTQKKTGRIWTNGTITKHLNKKNGGTLLFSYLILDFSMLAHIDMAGCQILTDLVKEYKERGVQSILLAGTSDQVYDSLVHSMALGCGPFLIFPSVHDAVEYANACRIS